MREPFIPDTFDETPAEKPPMKMIKFLIPEELAQLLDQYCIDNETNKRYVIASALAQRLNYIGPLGVKDSRITNPGGTPRNLRPEWSKP